MALHPQVQALLDAVTAQGTALTAALTELGSAESKVVDLGKQIGDLQTQLSSGGPAIDAEDLAALATATNTVASSVTTIKAALPQPVDASTVQAAADAAQAPPPAQ